MAVNLLDMVQSALGSTFTTEASRYLGESETSTRSAIDAALPALLAGFVQQGSTTSGASQLLASITSPQVDTSLTSSLSGWLTGGGNKVTGVLSQGQALLNSLCGDRTGGLASAVSAASGLKLSSVTTLLALVAPALLAFLKRYVTQNRIDGPGLAGLLSGQREHLRSRLDDRVAGALGLGSAATFLSGVAGSATAGAGRVADAARDVAHSGARVVDTYAALPTATPIVRRPWFWGALAAAALVAWLAFQNWAPSVQQSAQSVATSVATAMKSIDLPGGVKLNVSTDGFLDSLAGFLASKDVKPVRSFTFDELQFETGSARLTPASSRQIESLAAMLKAYPNVAVNVAGHTDNTGDAAANKRLSAERAAAVKQALVAMGVPAARITDEGLGPDKPIASNDTEDGRAKNRRVELLVTKI